MSRLVLLDPDPTRRPALAAALANVLPPQHRIAACGDVLDAAAHIDRGAEFLVADADAYPDDALAALAGRRPGGIPAVLGGSRKPLLPGIRTIHLEKPFDAAAIARAIRTLAAFSVTAHIPPQPMPLVAERRPDPPRQERPDPRLPGVPSGPAPEPPAGADLEADGEDGLGGPSAAIRRVSSEIRSFAEWDLSVVIIGESGTGKELAARRMHRLSRRAAAPFVALNCAGLGEELAASQLFGTERGAFTGAVERRGALEEAGEGTLFLDELGEMRPSVQALLLRALEEREAVRLGGSRPRPFAARVVAATHADLASQGFRTDLLARLLELELLIPPLRERLEDLPWLCARFLARDAPGKAFSAAALGRLAAHHWPGNVRELKNVTLRAAVASGKRDAIEPGDINYSVLGRRRSEEIKA